jgi:predicted nucleic acid-binding protein
MSVFVDTSVWSLAWRRDVPVGTAPVQWLAAALERGDVLYTTGLVLQELLQGFNGPKAKRRIVNQLATLPFVVPEKNDHVDAAELKNHCRRRGVQVGTIDALLAQLCIRHRLRMLTADADFRHVARHAPLLLVDT